MNIVVLDGNENQAVACVRSLGRAGHRVRVGSEFRWSKAGWSRFSAGQFRYAAPRRDADAFVRDVAAEARRVPGTLILPMTERTTLPLSTQRDVIAAAGGRLVLPTHEIVLRTYDKEQTTKLAASLGVAVPRTVVVTEARAAREIVDALRFPVVLKPRSSEEMGTDGSIRTTGAPIYARDPTEFSAAFDEMHRRSGSILVQEFVDGEGAGYFVLMRHGDLIAEFAHRRIRDVRPTGSGSCLRESVLPHPRIREAGLAILRALRWHGVAMVEFRVSSDGTPVFMEVNGRFWNSLPLAVYAGVDFPALLVQMAETGDAPVSHGYRTGVRCRWLLGDLRHLVEVWRGAPAGFTGPFPARLSTLGQFLIPVRGTYHDNFMVSDPMPEVGDWVDFLARRLPGWFTR